MRFVRCVVQFNPTASAVGPPGYIASQRYVSHVPTTALKVNGQVCLLHLSTGPNCKYHRVSGGTTSYYSFHVSKKRSFCRADFHVMIFGEKPRYFIIPQSSIKTVGINIPAQGRSNYNNRKPKIDYLKFENRSIC